MHDRRVRKKEKEGGRDKVREIKSEERGRTERGKLERQGYQERVGQV